MLHCRLKLALPAVMLLLIAFDAPTASPHKFPGNGVGAIVNAVPQPEGVNRDSAVEPSAAKLADQESREVTRPTQSWFTDTCFPLPVLMANPESITPAYEVELGTARAEVAAPFAAAIRAHHDENWPQLLGVQHIADGKMNWVSTGVWFGQDTFREQVIDTLIAAGIQGPVLDVGAGVGRMALKLQDAGVDVVALDCEPTCVELLRAKGLRNVVHADIRTFETTQRFQTIVFMDSTFGLIGDVEAAGELLSKLRSLLLPNGVVLVQDMEFTLPVVNLEWRFVFRDQVGPYFRWLNFSFAGLNETVRQHGWSARKLEGPVHPLYVAELRPVAAVGTPVRDFLRRRWTDLAILIALIWTLMRL